MPFVCTMAIANTTFCPSALDVRVQGCAVHAHVTTSHGDRHMHVCCLLAHAFIPAAASAASAVLLRQTTRATAT